MLPYIRQGQSESPNFDQYSDTHFDQSPITGSPCISQGPMVRSFGVPAGKKKGSLPSEDADLHQDPDGQKDQLQL